MNDSWRSLQDSYRTLRQRRRRRRWVAVAWLAFLFLAGYPLAKVALHLEGPTPKTEAGEVPGAGATVGRDILRQIQHPTPALGPGGVYGEQVDGRRIVYTLDPELQELAESVLRQYRVPYGAFVALEPATGRVLAMAEYSQQEPGLRDFCRRATYPAASLIKVITASQALATGSVTPATVVRFEGSPYVLHPRKLSPQRARFENNQTTVAEALGKSNNVVFAKLGSDLVGAERLEGALRDFAFNRPIPFDFPLQPSRASVPRERYELARTSAGFGEVYLSPVHAALIAAAVGNRGVMMAPYLVQSIQDRDGKVLYRAEPRELGRALDGQVAATLASMMENTVTRGTSSRVFHRYARNLWKDVGVAGKTGSLTGDDPPGTYEWFIGFAPVGAPRIAVASLVVNHELWQIKGSFVAQAVMREFFGM